MTASDQTRPLPPGSMGLPLVGESLSFAKDGFGFIDERIAAHGKIFKTHLLGRKTVVISGPEACARFIDPRCVMREDSMPPHVQQLFAGRSLPLLDGSDHARRKTLVLAGFTPEALESYLPVLQRTIERSLDRWEKLGDFSWLPELKRLALEGVCANVLSLEPGPRLEALLAGYQKASQGISAVPLRLPGTTFSTALKALDGIMSILKEAIGERRENPAQDALSRLLAARTPEGDALTDEEAKLELHHIVIAGYIIFAEFAATLMHWRRDPGVLRRLREEVKAHSPEGPLTAEQFGRMPEMLRCVMETKRLCPILPAIFGKARESFEFKGFTVPKDWMVLWALRATNMDADTYPAPERFDPGRFTKERAEHRRHEHAFVPHGPGPAMGHRCPGMDYATWFMTAFNVLLLRKNEWTLPDQDFDYRWNMAPPEPRGGLDVLGFRAAR